MKVRLFPAVLSGGSGSRLWPLSTDAAPKQFHALCSDRTMLQDALARFMQSDRAIAVLPPIIVGSAMHAAKFSTLVAELNLEPAAIVLEPVGRNSAPAAAVAARLAQAHDPNALVILMAADHLIPDVAGFRQAVADSAQAAADHIVVFGVEPTGPETGYGYIQAGVAIDGPVSRVARFAEKPDQETAKAYIAQGGWFWNAGIFLFSPAVMLAELEQHAPEVLRAVDAALAAAEREGAVIRLDAHAFSACPSISIDYAVMEKTDRAAVTPIGVDWADVGSWSELWRLGPLDDRDNFKMGDAVLMDTDGSLVWAGSRTVGVIGVKDLIVVETEGAVLVLPKSRAQDVKHLVELIKSRGK